MSSSIQPSGRIRSLLFSIPMAVVLSSSLLADRIYLVSGEPIEDCTIVSETMTEVTYKEGSRGKASTVPADNVLRIDYVRVPELIQQADNAFAEDDLGVAFEVYQLYLEEHAERPERKQLWAPAYAANRLMELHEIVGDKQSTIEAADSLISKFSDSRYLPGAYMTKANAQADLGKGDDAKSTLEKLEKLIIAKDLSKRWSLECRLSKILVDAALVGAKQREALKTVETDAGGEYPTVRNRATVALGESYLKDASSGGAESAAARDKARGYFEDVIEDPSADLETLAGAYTGLGDCQFQVAAESNNPDDIRESLMTFLRVVVLYRDEVRYAPKAMFYAGRCFNKLGSEDDNERANKLYSRVIGNYSETTWADQARDFRNK